MKLSSVESGKSAGLGAVLEEYNSRNRASTQWAAALIGAILLLGGMFALGYGLYSGYDSYYKHGPAVVWQNTLLPVCLGLLLILAGGIFLIVALSRRRISVVIYDQGFVYRERKAEETWRWEDLASIRTAVARRYFAGIRVGTRHAYTLVKRDGERLLLDDRITKVETLAERIREKILPLLYARLAPSLGLGQELAFGPLQLCKDKGIVYGKKTIAWKSVRQAIVKNGVLTISANSNQKALRPVRIPIADIPNADILLTIIQQLVDCEPTPDSK